MFVEPYERKNKLYHCGNELKTFSGEKTIIYTILSLDLSEASLMRVYSDGDIEVVYSEQSFIDNKQRSGGQSAPRFQRIRQQQIKNWYKKIDRMLMTVNDDIILDMNPVFKNRFVNCLHQYNKDKLIKEINTGYSGITGVYQALNIINE